MSKLEKVSWGKWRYAVGLFQLQWGQAQGTPTHAPNLSKSCLLLQEARRSPGPRQGRRLAGRPHLELLVELHQLYLKVGVSTPPLRGISSNLKISRDHTHQGPQNALDVSRYLIVLSLYWKESPQELSSPPQGCPALSHLLVSIPEAPLVISYRVPDDPLGLELGDWEAPQGTSSLGPQGLPWVLLSWCWRSGLAGLPL